MSLFKNSFTISFFTLISRILGYLRDIFFAYSFGASRTSDIFFVAFRLPNLFRKFYAEGAFNAAFIPIFSKELNSNGKKQAILFAEKSFSLIMIILIFTTVLVIFFMPSVIKVFAPGFIKDPEKLKDTIFFARIMFPYLILISLISLMSGILNSFNKFIASSFTPAILNIALIFGLTLNIYIKGKSLFLLSVFVILGGIAQFAWLAFCLHKSNITINIKIPEFSKNIKTLLRRILPGILGNSATQISTWINTIISTSIPNAVSFLYYADRIIQFPLAIIGTAIGTALLPEISKKTKSGQSKEVTELVNKALQLTLLFSIPSAAGLIIMPDLIVSLIFKYGAFDISEVEKTSRALFIYAFGLPAFAMIKIFSPVFFAHGDTKTPVKIAILCLIISTAISISLVSIISYTAIPVATSVSSWINNILLIIMSLRKDFFFFTKDTYKKILYILFSSAVMCLVIYLLKTSLPYYISGHLLVNLIIILTAAISYFATLHLIGYNLKSVIYA